MKEIRKDGIALEHISLTLKGSEGSNELFRDLNLYIEQRAFLSVTGPSGSGKSTFLQLIALFRKPDTGTILWGDTELTALDEQQKRLYWNRQMGFVYQDCRLIPAFNTVENVMVPLLCGGMPKRQARLEAMAMLKRVNMEEKACEKPCSLSGGEAQRAAIARALVCRPGLVLADEPTASLDPENAAAVFSLLEELHRNGSTILLATHDKELAGGTKTLVFKTETGHSVPEWI